MITLEGGYLGKYIQDWPVRGGKTRPVIPTDAKLFLCRCGLIGSDFEGVEYFDLDYIVEQMEGAIEKSRSSESLYQEKNDEWAKGTFEIRHRDLSKHLVNGYVHGNYGIHNAGGSYKPWSITAIDCGWCLGNYDRLKDAKYKVSLLEQWRELKGFQWKDAVTNAKVYELAREGFDLTQEQIDLIRDLENG